MALLSFLGAIQQVTGSCYLIETHDGMQALGVESERPAIIAFLLATALVHAAFEQNPYAVVGLNEVARAGHLLNGTEKTEQSHTAFLSIR